MKFNNCSNVKVLVLICVCALLNESYVFAKPQTREMLDNNQSEDMITHIDQIELSKFFIESELKSQKRKAALSVASVKVEKKEKNSKNISKKVTLHDNNKEQKLLVIMESDNAN